jgi:hypothetical protein
MPSNHSPGEGPDGAAPEITRTFGWRIDGRRASSRDGRVDQ